MGTRCSLASPLGHSACWSTRDSGSGHHGDGTRSSSTASQSLSLPTCAAQETKAKTKGGTVPPQGAQEWAWAWASSWPGSLVTRGTFSSVPRPGLQRHESTCFTPSGHRAAMSAHFIQSNRVALHVFSLVLIQAKHGDLQPTPPARPLQRRHCPSGPTCMLEIFLTHQL